MNDDTFEEKASLRLSPMNVFVIGGTIIITLITLVIYLVAFTPLREYIPGYADVSMQRNLIALELKADSMEADSKAKDLYIGNIKTIMEGKDGNDLNKRTSVPVRFDTIKSLRKSKEDSMLRLQIESQDQFDIPLSDAKTFSNDISSFFFFTPLKGIITNKFDPAGSHYGIDIVAPHNEAIKATVDGTVIISNWSSETGYVIGIQHSNNLISLYKHNSVLLKKTGNFVKAGEVIAIIGESGELSTGPHLHFELWYNGTPMNPQDYIAF